MEHLRIYSLDETYQNEKDSLSSLKKYVAFTQDLKKVYYYRQSKVSGSYLYSSDGYRLVSSDGYTLKASDQE